MRPPPTSSSAVSGGNDSGYTSEITITGNYFYDCDHAALAKQGNFYTFLNNTIVRQTHAGGQDSAGAVLCLRDDETIAEGAGSYFEGNVKIDGDFIVPAHTHFWGRLTVTGSLELGPRSTVALDVSCWNAVIGSQCRIKGPLVAHGDVTILDHAMVHSVEAGGRVVLRPGVTVGDVRSGDAIIVHGKIRSGNLVGKSMKVLGD